MFFRNLFSSRKAKEISSYEEYFNEAERFLNLSCTYYNSLCRKLWEHVDAFNEIKRSEPFSSEGLFSPNTFKDKLSVKAYDIFQVYDDLVAFQNLLKSIGKAIPLFDTPIAEYTGVDSHEREMHFLNVLRELRDATDRDREADLDEISDDTERLITKLVISLNRADASTLRRRWPCGNADDPCQDGDECKHSIEIKL